MAAGRPWLVVAATLALAMAARIAHVATTILAAPRAIVLAPARPARADEDEPAARVAAAAALGGGGGAAAPPADEAADEAAEQARASAAQRDAEDEAAEGDGAPDADPTADPPAPGVGGNSTRQRLSARSRLALRLSSPEGRALDVGTLELTPEKYVFGQLVRVMRNGRPVAVPQQLPPGVAEAAGGGGGGGGPGGADEGAAPRRLSPLEQLANALRVPARGVCFVAAGAFTGGRYTNNIYHQAEFVWPMVDAAIRDARAPATVLWPFALLPWSKQVLELLLPLTDVLAGAEATATVQQARCTAESVPFKAVGSGGGKAGYWLDPRSAPMARKLTLRRCRRPLRNASAASTVVLLERRAEEAAGAHGRKRRRIAQRAAVLALLRAAMPGASVELRFSPGADVPLCAQLGAFADAALVLTPHGAQLNNAVFAPARTALLEAMPWAKRSYPGHLAMLRYSGLTHARVHSARPPAEDGQWGDGRYTEAQCEAIELCSRYYRDSAEIHLPPRELHAALAAAAPDGLAVRPWAEVAHALERAGWRIGEDGGWAQRAAGR